MRSAHDKASSRPPRINDSHARRQAALQAQVLTLLDENLPQSESKRGRVQSSMDKHINATIPHTRPQRAAGLRAIKSIENTVAMECDKENLGPDREPGEERLTLTSLKQIAKIPSESARNLSSLRHTATSYEDIDSQSKREMRFILSRTITVFAETLCPRYPNELAADFLSHQAKITGKAITHLHDETVQDCVRIIDLLPARSLQRRVLDAVVCASHTRPQANALVERVCSESISLYGKDRFARGRRDFAQLREGVELSKPTSSRRRFSEDVAMGYLNFILDDHNIQTVAWGVRSIDVDGVLRHFPSIMRKQRIKRLWEVYEQTSDDKKLRIGRTSFNLLTRTITSSDRQIRKCLDYVTKQLVYDNFELLRSIVGGVIPIDDGRADYEKTSTQIENFLKYQYPRHITSTMEATHCAYYALRSKATDGMQSLPFSCDQCRRVFVWFRQIRHKLGDMQKTDELRVVEECEHKTVLFMAHVVRQMNQKERIGVIISELAPSQALVVLDFKMKFEPMYYRESTAQHYGKRGISWHGVCVRYLDEDKQLCAMYIDHVFENDNKQDKLCVLVIIEAVLTRIRRVMPQIDSCFLQADNACTYQNKFLPLFLSAISRSTGIKIRGVVHTETQDGKSLVDAHFAVANKHVKAYSDTGHDVSTPQELAFALQWCGGVTNSVVELLWIDRSVLDKFQKQFDTVSRVASKLLMRTNEIVFHGGLDEDAADLYEYSNLPTAATLRLSVLHFNNKTYSCDVSLETGNIDVASRVVEDQEEIEDDRFGDDEDEASPGDSNDSSNINPQTLETFPWTSAKSLEICNVVSERRFKKQIKRKLEQKQISRDEPEVCENCGQLFASYLQLVGHECEGRTLRSDLMAFVKREAYKMLVRGELRVTSVVTEEISLPARIELPLIPFHFYSGWAERPAHGSFYGAKRVDTFKPDIKKLFDDGVRDKSKKKNPSQMLTVLKGMYGVRFDYPSPTEIATYVSSLSQRQKKEDSKASRIVEVPSLPADENDQLTESTHSEPPKKRVRLDPKYTRALETLVGERGLSVSTSDAIQHLRTKFEGDVDFPDTKRVAAKVSYLKTIARKLKKGIEERNTIERFLAPQTKVTTCDSVKM